MSRPAATQARRADNRQRVTAAPSSGGPGSGGMLPAPRNPIVPERRDFPVAKIDTGRRRAERPVDPAWVEVLAASLSAEGVMEQAVGLEMHADGKGADLLWGLVRHDAAKSLGWPMVPATIYPAPERPEDGFALRRKSLLENLARSELSALDRASHLAALKQLHEEMFPETRHGGGRKSGDGAQVANIATLRFSTVAADITGLSERAIQLATEIYHGLLPESRERLRPTPHAGNQSALKALAQAGGNLQVKALDLLLCDPPKAASVADALTLASGGRLATPSEKQYRALSDGLARVTKAARAELFDLYEDEIVAHAKKRGWL